MAERRPLTAGLKLAEEVVDPAIEKQFVHGDKAKAEQAGRGQTIPSPSTDPRDPRSQSPINRVHFTTRIRADFAATLKRASLERQLAGQFPNTIQDFLEEALEPWMRANGYLP
jgi:hypothetical protein